MTLNLPESVPSEHTAIDNNADLPNGLEESGYPDWQNWDYRRWAWEFLRRNHDFRRACDSLPTGTKEASAKKREICQTYSLRRFKRYDEAYAEGAPAQFRALTLSPLPNDDAKRWSRTLRDDEVCIVFKLRPSLFGSQALKRQLELAERIVERRTNRLRKKLKITRQAHAPEPTTARLFHRLRLLDLFRLNQHERDPWIRIARHLESRSGIDILDLVGTERKAHEEALQYVHFGYLALLTSKTARIRLPSVRLNATSQTE